MKGAIYVEDSKNAKLGDGQHKIDTTYASIKSTCSPTCPLNKNGCYAQGSFVGMINARMNRRARGDSPLAVARAEAKAIDESYGGGKVPAGRPLRIHTSGDSKTWAGTRIIANAVKHWKMRGGGEVFTYTHSHAHVPRELWGSVSVLASIESTSQVAAVRAMGYAPAIVVATHTSDKAGVLPGSDTVFIPCPAQTKENVSCSSCRLCMKGDWLYETNRGISFAAHGINKSSLKRRLTVLE